MDLSSLMFPLLLILFAVPLFLSARKQKKAAAEQQELLSALEPGDRVMTTSGLFATVADASDEATIDLEVADGVVTTWLRQAVREKVDTSIDTADTADEADEVSARESDAVVDATPASSAIVAPPLDAKQDSKN
ncbi:preprotein translocase, YajC subunit [Actinosynnema mirum DSM 43827]|uniref:Preprotein translocase, YajC subunit n=2 Tax=Actinosynnema TaxID=40566 RepID=C6WCM6_ACTMD|nr:preprotein translocase, YajC subunit [Actinosynnema mirum DSM 43827]AXX29073.1 Preprotein translocase subunit YajC [Actinosynnema pretiosum subsp. pretiosum]